MANLRSVLTSLILMFFILTLPNLSFAATKQVNIPLDQIDQIVVFGDSLSDVTNLKNFTTNLHSLDPTVPILPPDPPYFEGRCSSGYLWVERLARKLNLSANLVNYAYAGSKVKNTDVGKDFLYDLTSLVSRYITLNFGFFPPATNNHLYIIWDGSNDYLSPNPPYTNDPEALTSLVTSNLQTQIEKLITDANAKYFLVLNIVDLGVTPKARKNPDPAYAKSLTQLAELHNAKLAVILDHIEQTKNVKIARLDTFSAVRDIVNHKENYNLANVTDPCYQGTIFPDDTAKNNPTTAMAKNHLNVSNNKVTETLYTNVLAANNNLPICNNPSTYLFWDNLHPTATAHNIIANKAYQILQKNQ